jgi:hypothetical protein
MKFILPLALILLCIISCKESEIESFKMEIGKIQKIELLVDKDVSFGSMDSTKIAQFVSFLMTAGKDNAERDFTSHDFIKFHGSDGKVFQIEIFKHMFKANGRVFVLNGKIIQKMRVIFDNNSLIETPALNTR